MACVNNLDYHSAFVAELRGGQQFRGWDPSRYQYAALINAIRIQSHLFILANSDPKKRKPQPPEPWPIPDHIPKTKQPDKPGSFAFIARRGLAASKQKKAGLQWQDPEEQKLGASASGSSPTPIGSAPS